MTYSAINLSPSVGSVGVKATVTFGGTPSSTNSPPTVYAYIQSAPANSKLRTLDQYAVLVDYIAGKYSGAYTGPLPVGIDRKELRLESTAAGPVFTPDVPGRFTVRTYDVTEYHFVPHYGGHVPASGELAETDNELAALPAYAGGTAQAVTATTTYWVEETHTRLIGIAPDTAVLSVTGYNDHPSELRLDRVMLTPANTAVAKQAMLDADVRAALLTLQGVTSGIDATFIVSNYYLLIQAFNAHFAVVTNYTTHTIVDATNTLATSVCTDLATGIAVLNDMRTKYAAHRVLIAGTVHNNADVTNVTTAAVCTDFGSAVTLFVDLRDRLYAHGINGPTVHIANAGSFPVDGAMNEWIEAPFPGSVAHFVKQVNKLADIYQNHLRKVVNSAHVNADLSNTFAGLTSTYDSVTSLATALNTCADAFERHVANIDKTGVAAASPYHGTVAEQTKIPLRATDMASCQRLAEQLAYELERHALNKSVHQNFEQWGQFSSLTCSVDSYVARLTRAWNNATRVTSPTDIEFGSVVSKLVSKGGFALPLRWVVAARHDVVSVRRVRGTLAVRDGGDAVFDEL